MIQASGDHKTHPRKRLTGSVHLRHFQPDLRKQRLHSAQLLLIVHIVINRAGKHLAHALNLTQFLHGSLPDLIQIIVEVFT